jgi:hypothetical protein
MQDITELTVLLRVTTELPCGLRIITEDFQEDWNFVRSGDLHRFDEAIRGCGWHFIWIADPSQHRGLGRSEQTSIASALKLALRRVGPEFNAANIDGIEITRYPWFFIAKVKIYPYQIQESAVLQESNLAIPLPMTAPGELTPIRESLTAHAALPVD